MNFLNPLALFGLLAAGIPILLHLLNLRRIKKVEFSSLRFLKELKKSQIRRIKLRQILLLILRTLLVILIVGAFARPMIKGSLPGFRNYAKTSAVIFIDNSLSMNFSDEYGNRFNYAKRIAKKIVEQLNTGDEIAIVETSGSQIIEDLEFYSDFKTLTDKINKVQINYEVSNFSNKLNLLPAIFENAKNVNREVFIISDNQKANFDNFDTTKLDKFQPSFYFLEIGNNSKMDFNNLSLDSVKFITRIFQQNKSLLMSGQMYNHSSEKRNNSVLSMILNEERVAQRKFSIPEKYRNDIQISSNLKTDKLIKGYLELEADALEEDNKRYFGIIIPEKPKIAYISESHNTFILSALGYGKEQSYNETTLFSVQDFNSKDLSVFDALILSSYTNLSENKLNEFLNLGGRVFLLPSDNKSDQNKVFLSTKLGEVQNLTLTNGQNGVISSIIKSHPLFEGVFLDETNSNSPDNIRINQLSTIKSGLPIIETTNGALLSEIKQGNGHILYLSVAPEDNWSNIQNSTLFPVILYRGLLYLSMLPELSKEIIIGEPAQIIIPSKFAKGSNFKIIDPNSLETPVNSPTLPSGAIINVKNITIPGNYLIINSNNENVGIISANLSPKESDLTILPKDEIEKLLVAKYSDDVHVAFIDDLNELRDKIERVRTGTELWYFLIVLAIIVALAELVVQRVMKNEVVED